MAGNNSIQFLRGTSSQRASCTETSLAGQPVYETDTNRLYVGDGETSVNDLTAVEASAADIAENVKDQNNGAGIKIWIGTQAEFEGLSETDEDTIYYITDIVSLLELDEEVTTLKQQLLSGDFKVGAAAAADKASQDDVGNNISATYAKLSQVVRVDAAQQLTDAQKWTFSKNSRFILKKEVERTLKWKTVACISNYGQVCMTISTDLPGSGHLIAKFLLAIGYGDAANITQIGYTGNSPISAIRLRSTTSAETYVDLLFNNRTAIETTVSVYFEANLTNAYGTADIQLFDFVDFSGDESDYTITRLNLDNSGINTTGTIYQQGVPVLVGDQSAIFEPDGTTVKEATKAGTIGKYLHRIHISEALIGEREYWEIMFEFVDSVQKQYVSITSICDAIDGLGGVSATGYSQMSGAAYPIFRVSDVPGGLKVEYAKGEQGIGSKTFTGSEQLNIQDRRITL